VTPLSLPQSCPRATTCAVEITLYDGSKAAILSCYLPQTLEAHAATCAALTQLPGTLPHSLIIMGGDLQGGWTTSSPKDAHIAELPYHRWRGPMLPTFTPRQRPLMESCIDHLTLWDPQGLTLQTSDITTIPTAFLDHRGVQGTLSLPIAIGPDFPPPSPRPPRVPTFRYPIPEHSLDAWKSKVAIDSHGAIALAVATGHALLASLPPHTSGSQSDPRSDTQIPGLDILGLANDIQTILGDALTEATKIFPLKTAKFTKKGTLPRHLWPKKVARIYLVSGGEPRPSAAFSDTISGARRNLPNLTSTQTSGQGLAPRSHSARPSAPPLDTWIPLGYFNARMHSPRIQRSNMKHRPALKALGKQSAFSSAMPADSEGLIMARLFFAYS
jgi:hypothetical protein